MSNKLPPSALRTENSRAALSYTTVGGSAGAGGSEGSEGEGGSGGSSGAGGAGTVEADVSTLTKTGDFPYALAALAAAVGAAAVLAAVLVRSRRGSR